MENILEMANYVTITLLGLFMSIIHRESFVLWESPAKQLTRTTHELYFTLAASIKPVKYLHTRLHGPYHNVNNHRYLRF